MSAAATQGAGLTAALRTAARAGGWHAAVLLGLAALSYLLYGPGLGQPLNYEESAWIRGEVFGTNFRLLPSWLLHHVCLPWLAENFLAYRFINLVFHLACSFFLYLLVFRLAHGCLTGAPRTARAAGLLAGVLFMLWDFGLMRSIAALSYQMVLLCCLLSLLGLSRLVLLGQRWAWGVVILGYGLALYCHSFSLGLPLLVALVELALRRGGVARAPCRPGWVAVRYLVLLLLVVVAVVSRNLTSQHAGVEGLSVIVGLDKLVGMSQEFSLLRLFAQHYWIALTFAHELPREKLIAPSLALDLGTLAALALLAAAGLRAAWVRAGAALPLLAVLGIGWPAMVFLLLLMGGHDNHSFRYYFTGAGMVAGFSLGSLWLLYRLSRSLPPRLRGRALGAAVPLASAGLLLVLGGLQGRHLPALAGERGRALPPAHPLTWAPPPGCRQYYGDERAGLVRAARAGHPLRCSLQVGAHLQGVDLSGADLTGSNFTGARLLGARLPRARLEGASLVWVDFTNGLLERARLRGANLSGAVMHLTRLSGADLTGVVAQWADLSNSVLRQVTLRGATLTNLNMQGVDLRGADLTGANMYEADLRRAHLSGAVMRGVNLRQARIGEAELRGTDLREADLSNVDLRGADLRGADLRGATLIQVLLEGAQLKGVKGELPGREDASPRAAPPGSPAAP